jgi:UDP-N-acetylenolpyruvoylglucosamine reductase
LGAAFRGQPGAKEAIAKRTAEFNARRWSSQPREPSAGCIFKNPSPSLSAGKLIEELGLKGTRCGGAVVSTVHGNFIVNDRDATARDVLQLIEIIQTRARAERGVELRTEVEIIGEEGG